MKRVSLLTLLLAALAFAGVALAHGRSDAQGVTPQASGAHGRPTTTLPNADTPGYNHGNQECYLMATQTLYATPGLMFQAMRQTADGKGQTGDNPEQWIESYGFPGTVGDFIRRNCQVWKQAG